jgi:hypothetical protein
MDGSAKRKGNGLGPWVRVYADDVKDPARYALSDKNYRTLDDLERLAGLSAGVLPSEEAIAFRLRLEPKDVERRPAALIEAGFLVRDGDALRLRDWSRRQYESDNSTPRVQAHRERKKQAYGNDEETFHETFRETEETPNETAISDQIRSYQSRSSSSEGGLSRSDDDELLHKLRQAANGRIEARCVDTRPIRMLMDEGVKLDAILTVVHNRVPKLKTPLENLGATWLVEAIRDFAKAPSYATATPSREGVREERAWVRTDHPDWQALVQRYEGERGKKLPPPTKGVDGHFGWRFPAEWLEDKASSLSQN